MHALANPSTNILQTEKFPDKNPTRVEIHINKGKELARRENGLEAIEQFKEAIRLQPNNVEAHFGLRLHIAFRLPL